MINCYAKVNNIINFRINGIEEDIKKLNNVEHLLGEEATTQKRCELVNTIMALQDVQFDVLEAREQESGLSDK